MKADSAAHAVLNAINGDSLHLAEIADHTGLARSTVRRVLKRLEGDLVDYLENETENERKAKYWHATDDGVHVCNVLDGISSGDIYVVDGVLYGEDGEAA